MCRLPSAIRYVSHDTRLPATCPPPQAMDKSADFRGPFELPGTRLFADFCREVVRRYCLDEPGVVQQGMVSDYQPKVPHKPLRYRTADEASGMRGRFPVACTYPVPE